MTTGRMGDVRQVVLPSGIVQATLARLQQFGESGCEGLVLWVGTIDQQIARVEQGLVPPQRSISDEDGVGYFVDGETLFDISSLLAERGLRLIAQVHSHPGEAYHSATDDRYAIATAEGTFSLVVPNFGDAATDLSDWAVYRLSESGWLELERPVVTTIFDLY